MNDNHIDTAELIVLVKGHAEFFTVVSETITLQELNFKFKFCNLIKFKRIEEFFYLRKVFSVTINDPTLLLRQ